MSSSLPIDVLVFDLDDTLYPERTYAVGALADVARVFEPELNPPFPLHQRLCEIMDTQSRTRTFNRVLEELGRDDAETLVPRMLAVYRAHHPRLRMHADAEAALERWSGRLPLGLLTDGFVDIQNAKIDALSIREKFSTIAITGQWGNDYFKPHPRGYEHIMQQLQVSGPRCLYVADNVSKDFVAALQLGWKTVCIRRPDGFYADVAVAPEGAPETTIASLDELDSTVLGYTIGP